MKQEDIIEGNRAIAEFLGWEERYFTFGNAAAYTPVKDTPNIGMPTQQTIYSAAGLYKGEHKSWEEKRWQRADTDKNGVHNAFLDFHRDWDRLMMAVEKPKKSYRQS